MYVRTGCSWSQLPYNYTLAKGYTVYRWKSHDHHVTQRHPDHKLNLLTTIHTVYTAPADNLQASSAPSSAKCTNLKHSSGSPIVLTVLPQSETLVKGTILYSQDGRVRTQHNTTMVVNPVSAVSCSPCTAQLLCYVYA